MRVLLLSSLTLLISASVQGKDIDAQLLKQTVSLQKYIKKHKAKSIGVLRFHSRIGDLKGFQVAPIGYTMAKRLETVLILAREGKNGLDYHVLRDPNRVIANSKKRINWLDVKKRKQLFDFTYPVQIGEEDVKADLFLTGDVVMNDKSKTTTIRIIGIRKEMVASPDLISKITMKTTRTLLADAGRSFLIKRSSLVENGPDATADLLDLLGNKDATEREKTNEKEEPTSGGDTPNNDPQKYVSIKMMIQRNGQTTPQEVIYEEDPSAEGRGRFRLSKLQEPKQGDKVFFLLKNHHSARVAVVLKVNQENTLYQETMNAADCSKWVLDPNEELKVEGFYSREKDEKTKKNIVRNFQVLSEEESQLLTQQISTEPLTESELGTVQMWAYLPLEKKSPDYKVVLHRLRSLRGRELAKARKSIKTYRDLRASITREVAIRKKALIAPGEIGDGSKLKEVDFRNPQEVQYVFIRYYRP